MMSYQTPSREALRAANFGDPRDWQVRELEKYEARSAELLRRFLAGEYLSKADLKDARKINRLKTV